MASGRNKLYRAYTSWLGMRGRCLYKTDKCYKHYGGRGIVICDSWINSFENFLNDMGERPIGHSLDRVNVNGNYEPSNCKWSTIEEQSLNRTDTLFITYKGETKVLIEWAKYLGLNYALIKTRIRRKGWDVARAFETPKITYK